MGNTKDKVDREMLHEYLWKNRGRADVVPWKQKELAEKLGITIWALSDIFRELRAANRVRKSGTHYYVNDPETFRWQRKTDATLFEP